MSDRLFAGAWLVVTALIAWVTGTIEVPFSYEPIGPRAFPWLLCILMAGAALRMIMRPDPEPAWPHGPLLGKTAVVIAALVGYAFAFEPLGFPLATFGATLAIGRTFGGSWRGCAIAGAVMGLGFWYFFDRMLEVTVPLGMLWS
jgi:putative tricarboxylic transport membrane protein